MNIFSAYISGLKKAFGMPKLWLILFGFNVLFALCIALPLKGLINKTVGNSLSLNASLEKFDFPFVTDFLNHYGDLFSGYLNQSFIFIIAYFLYSLFMMGGILEIIVNRNSDFKARNFWGGSGHYFWRIVRLFVYFSLIHIFVLVVFWLLFARQGLNPLKMENDTALIIRLQWMIPLFAFIHMIVSMFHDFAKIRMVKDDTSIITYSVRSSLKWVRKNFLRCAGLFFLNAIIGSILFLIYFNVKKVFPSDTNAGILTAFFIAQIFVLLRIGCKLVYFGSLNQLHEAGS